MMLLQHQGCYEECDGVEVDCNQAYGAVNTKGSQQSEVGLIRLPAAAVAVINIASVSNWELAGCLTAELKCMSAVQGLVQYRRHILVRRDQSESFCQLNMLLGQAIFPVF